MLLETATYKGYEIHIYQEENPDLFHPRESQDNLGIMACWHGCYKLGDQFAQENYPTPDDFNEWLRKHNRELIILPVYMYDHSGVCFNTTGYSCPWDSGQVGWIYVSKKEVREVFGWKVISPKRKEQIVKILRAEIEEYSQYMMGNVFRYEVRKPDTCESCGHKSTEIVAGGSGFVGAINGEVMVEAKGDVDALVPSPEGKALTS